MPVEGAPLVVNIADAPEEGDDTPFWTSYYKALTPALPRMGRLGVNVTRVPGGNSGCPCHTHQLEDEVFFVLSGRGLFRYGDTVREVGPGACITCPAGTGVGHQLANPFEEEFVYLGIGLNDPNEVCTYPDSGKVMVRALHKMGRLAETDYLDGEPAPTALLGKTGAP